MAKAYDFGKNQILRSEFLNSLQDLLQTYLDNFILTRSGNQVVLQATASEQVAVTIDKRMRQIPSTLVATPTGGAGTRDVYVSVRTNSFSLDVTTSPAVPTGGDLVAFRRVGTCTWDGALVTGVATTPVRTNADFLGGRSSSYEPVPYAVAVSNEDGRLHPDWFPEVADRQEAVGAIRRQWAVSNAAFVVPTQWALMDGRVLGPTEHSFPGVATIILPDMRNKVALGADYTKARSTAPLPSNLAAAAPGLGAISGDNTPRSFNHTHPTGDHNHLCGVHNHSMPHLHSVPAHHHKHDGAEQKHDDGPPHVNEMRVNYGRTESAAGGNTSTFSGNTSTSGNVTTSSNGSGNTNAGLPAALDVRPAHVGLVYLLKVH